MPQPGARSSVPLAPSRQPRPDQELVPLQVPQRALANFVVHCGDDLELGQAHPAAELLRKIASALHADTGQLGFFRSPAAQPDLAGLANPVFWFGDQSPAPDGAYVLPSLKTMLDDPASKRRAWAVLKPWVGRLE